MIKKFEDFVNEGASNYIGGIYDGIEKFVGVEFESFNSEELYADEDMADEYYAFEAKYKRIINLDKEEMMLIGIKNPKDFDKVEKVILDYFKANPKQKKDLAKIDWEFPGWS
jgi:hypothetical protein